MKGLKLLSLLLASLILFSVCSLALPALAAKKEEETTQADNSKILAKELTEFVKKNNIDAQSLCFGYCDINRELTYTYNGDTLFASYDAFKFPLAYLYFKDLASGKHHLNEDVGNDNLRAVFLRSLTKDYGHDENATELLIEKYGGMEAVKQALYELTYTKVDSGFFDSDALTVNYAIEFLKKYYSEALYCSTDFKHMLIDPIKQFSLGRYSETYIFDYKVTHRYGISRPAGACVDIGVVNSSNPFAFVISVAGSNPEEDVALLAQFAMDFNEEYGTLLVSQMTTLPDVDAEDKKSYDATTVKAVPVVVIVITATVLIAATITTVMIVRENKKKKEDRLD